MKNIVKSTKIAIVLLLAFALLFSAACGRKTDDDTNDSTVLEQGVNEKTDEEESTEETSSEDSGEESFVAEFVDKGEDSTLEDIIANQQQIRSFYFDQTVSYSDGEVFNQVWYKNGRMKLISSVDSQIISQCYYDYNAGTLTTYYTGSTTAVSSSFDFSSVDAPDNPVCEDFSGYTPTGIEEINGQLCLIVETQEGDMLWISTANGFPLQAEYTDSLGERMSVSYDHIQLNQVTVEDVSLPVGVTVR